MVFTNGLFVSSDHLPVLHASVLPYGWSFLFHSRTSDHTVCGNLFCVWLYRVDVPDIVCLHASVQRRRTYVASCIHKVTEVF